MRALVTFLFVKVGHCFACIIIQRFKNLNRNQSVENDQLIYLSHCHFVKIVLLGDLKARRLCYLCFYLSLSTVSVLTTAGHINADQSAYTKFG